MTLLIKQSGPLKGKGITYKTNNYVCLWSLLLGRGTTQGKMINKLYSVQGDWPSFATKPKTKVLFGKQTTKHFADPPTKNINENWTYFSSLPKESRRPWCRNSIWLRWLRFSWVSHFKLWEPLLPQQNCFKLQTSMTISLFPTHPVILPEVNGVWWVQSYILLTR